jgi:hypothetical protein
VGTSLCVDDTGALANGCSTVARIGSTESGGGLKLDAEAPTLDAGMISLVPPIPDEVPATLLALAVPDEGSATLLALATTGPPPPRSSGALCGVFGATPVKDGTANSLTT